MVYVKLLGSTWLSTSRSCLVARKFDRMKRGKKMLLSSSFDQIKNIEEK